MSKVVHLCIVLQGCQQETLDGYSRPRPKGKYATFEGARGHANNSLLSPLRHPDAAMKSFSGMLSLLALAIQAEALYFYIDGPTQKCFFEELPKDTLVVGTRTQAMKARPCD